MKLEPKFIPLAFRILAIILGIVGLIFLYQSSSNTYQIRVDGDDLTVRTHATVVGNILERAGITIENGDEVYPSLDEEINDRSLIEVRRTQSILLEWDDEVQEITTLGRSVGEIIADANQTLLPNDRVWLDGIPAFDFKVQLEDPPGLMGWQKSKRIQIDVDGEPLEIWSAAPTLGEALAEAGIVLRSSDELVPDPQTPISSIGQVSLRHAKPITVRAEDKTFHAWVVADTVGEALSDAGISLLGLDYPIPDIEEALPANGEIRLIQVREEVVIEQTPLPFTTGYQADPSLEIDQQSIIESGSYGVQARRIRVRFEDGEEVSRALEGEWVAREPEERKIGYGTNIVIRTMDTPDGPISYWRAIRMYATSYSPSRAGVPDDWPWYGKAACGKDLVKGIVAIDNRYIPFHTMMYVPGYGFAEACDIGGGVKGRWIDLGYEDHNWKNWHEYVTVYFLTPVPPASSIAWIFP